MLLVFHLISTTGGLTLTFGEKLQQIRKHHDLSQEQLAEKLGISRHTISRWETGQSMPDIDKILLISELFSVSTDYLLKDEIDNSIGKLTDYQTLKIVFWVSTALIFGGLLVSFLGWREYRNHKPVVLGSILGILGCVCFEVFHPRDTDRVLLRYMRRQFYSVNVWLLLPTPFYIATELISSAEKMKPLMPYLLGMAVYLIVSTAVTLLLMRKFKQ